MSRRTSETRLFHVQRYALIAIVITIFAIGFVSGFVRLTWTGEFSRIGFDLSKARLQVLYKSEEYFGWGVYGYESGFVVRWLDYPGYSLVPYYVDGRGEGPVRTSVPLWVPLIPFAVPLFAGWRHKRRRESRRRMGFCPVCGYDLTGNRSGRCPECGTPCEGDWNKTC